jgi:WD40 repeat protein
MNLDINANGTRMVSCSKTPEVIYWDLSKNSSKPILSIFEEDHENVIDVVVFVPLNAAKTIMKARSEEEQDQGNDEQTGGNVETEENKDEEEKTEEKQTSSEPATSKTAEALRKARERLNKLKNKETSKREEVEEEKFVEPEEDIVVKDELVATGSRDKRIKIWNAKRGT